MKKLHILALIVLAVSVGIIVSTAGDASTYVTFSDAKTMASKGENESVHVVGKLRKNAAGNIVGMTYEPAIDPNYFAFTLLDNDNQPTQVVYQNPKPQDFDKSEQVVVIGKMDGDVFKAEKILLKCPSKYENKKLDTTPAVASSTNG